MTPSIWEKVPHKFDAVFQLERYKGPRAVSYRYRYRREGIVVEGVLSGTDSKTGRKLELKEIVAEAERAVTKGRNKQAPKPASQERSADLCDEIVELRRTMREKTFEGVEIMSRVHVKPYLIDRCPYARDLNPTTWLGYKSFKRQENPTVTLFNHWKFFTMLFRYAYDKGILKERFKLEFDEETEDFRAEGKIIPDDHFEAFCKAANSTWYDRAILQRLTGQRPGVIRKLSKDRVNLDTGEMRVGKADSKNHREYSFILPGLALEILRARADNDSPFFFPSRDRRDRAMGGELTGWHNAWLRAREALLAEAAKLDGQAAAALRARAEAINLDDPYTPHDLRHSFLTEAFKDCPNPALVCYQCDLSLEEAMRTYIHFRAEDTRVLAARADEMTARLLGPAKEASNAV